MPTPPSSICPESSSWVDLLCEVATVLLLLVSLWSLAFAAAEQPTVGAARWEAVGSPAKCPQAVPLPDGCPGPFLRRPAAGH